MNLAQFQGALLALVECLCTEMQAIAEVAGEVCLCTLLPGSAVPQDYCQGQGCGGMAWVRNHDLTPNDAFDGRGVGCFTPMLATVELGIIRSVPTPGYNGLPSEDDHLEMSVRQMEDMSAACRAMQACSQSHEFTVGGYTPIGPQGGCFGGAWTLSFDVEM